MGARRFKGREVLVWEAGSRYCDAAFQCGLRGWRITRGANPAERLGFWDNHARILHATASLISNALQETWQSFLVRVFQPSPRSVGLFHLVRLGWV